MEGAYDIEQYFDTIESSKAAAIMRMIQLEVGETNFFNSIIVDNIIFLNFKSK